ncbi:MAG: hypothetical protein KGL39_29660 [Patescibacteria group bacterium]|nr:hypothetical protein [Patescibacteria group bacterium]
MPSLISLLLVSIARRKAKRKAREEAERRATPPPLPPRPPPLPPQTPIPTPGLSDDDALFLDELFGEDVRKSLPKEAPLSDELYAFLHKHEWLPVPQSSNVRAIQYRPDLQELYIEYGRKGAPSSIYGYGDIGPELAQVLGTLAVTGGSVGGGIWDNLRFRGTMHHKKPYWFLSGPSKAERKWNRTRRAAREHARKIWDPSVSPRRRMR